MSTSRTSTTHNLDYLAKTLGCDRQNLLQCPGEIVEWPGEYAVDAHAIRVAGRSHASVPLDDIVGTMHPRYKGMPWHEVVAVAPRMRDSLRLHRSNRKYYQENSVKIPSWNVATFDGGHTWYITDHGNHRTAIVKLDRHITGEFSTLHGMATKQYDLCDYATDVALLGRHHKVNYAVHKLHVDRVDRAGEWEDHYQLSFFLTVRGREYNGLTSAEAYELLTTLREPRLIPSFITRWLS